MQEVYERARDLSARDHILCKSRALAIRDQTRGLFSELNCWNIASSVLCIRAFSLWLSHLSKSSSMPLCKACPGCGGMGHIRNGSCSCGHVFVAKHKTPSRKHTLHSSRAIETVEKAADRRSVDKACKFKKSALETEEEALEHKSLNRACVAKKRVVDLKVAFKKMLHQGTELKSTG